MRVLFDHNIPSGATRALPHHEVTEAIQRGWERVSNGELIANAEAHGFDVFLTADKRIHYQQNLKARRIEVIVIGNSTWRILRKHLDRVAAAVDAATPGSYARSKFPSSEKAVLRSQSQKGSDLKHLPALIAA